jgi:hypothetical protein
MSEGFGKNSFESRVSGHIKVLLLHLEGLKLQDPWRKAHRGLS